jgi:hypothetical protein
VGFYALRTLTDKKREKGKREKGRKENEETQIGIH